jgi:hypothetical protein
MMKKERERKVSVVDTVARRLAAFAIRRRLNGLTGAACVCRTDLCCTI